MLKKSRKKTSKTNKLSKKEREFTKEYAKTGNATKAALKVYNTDKEYVAANIGSENLRKPKIIDALSSMLTDELVWGKQSQLLNDSDIQERKFHNISEENIREMFKGMVGYEVMSVTRFDVDPKRNLWYNLVYLKVPNTTIQEKVLDKIHKIRGDYAEDKLPEGDKSNKTYNFFFDPVMQNKIKEYEDNIKKQVIQHAKTTQNITEAVVIDEQEREDSK